MVVVTIDDASATCRIWSALLLYMVIAISFLAGTNEMQGFERSYGDDLSRGRFSSSDILLKIALLR